ncbi:MAG TPA: alpha/beta hydrolase [Anaerolineales bacterium]|jgi:pimeloyl-ACP methyl ester carboxylesterase|nr:alpha/beta hydrolase [Anaerolineales bacterium]
MSAIIIGDKIVHYEVLGRGKPILFLHGWVGSWRYWIQAMQAASTSYRAYAFDMWGYGETAKDEVFYSLNEQADLVNQFMNAMGIGKVALVGHGLGALVALSFAARYAYVVDRLMAISVPLSGEGLLDWLGDTSAVDFANRLLEQKPSSEAVRADISKMDMKAVMCSLEDLTSVDVPDMISKMTSASLAVHGLKDPLNTFSDLAENGNLPSMFHQITFDDSGHFPMLDQPNKFNRLMNDFLALPSGESPRQLSLKDEWKRRVR